MSSVERTKGAKAGILLRRPVRRGSGEAGKAACPYLVHDIMLRKIGVALLDAVL